VNNVEIQCQMTSVQHKEGGRILRRFVAFFVVLAATLGLGVAPALADPPVPRFVGSRLPAGYTLQDYSDITSRSSTIRYIQYLRNDANTKAVSITAEPAQKTEWDSAAASLKGSGLKPVKIKTFKGFVDVDAGVTTYLWFEKNRIIVSRSIGYGAKAHQLLNASVVVTRLPDASFGFKKAPAGLGVVYSGLTSGLFGSSSRLTYGDSNDNALILDVSSIDRRALEVYLLSPFNVYGSTVVAGKPAYVIETARYVEVWWEEQPGLLVEVLADDLPASALVEYANSVAAVDEPTWQALVTTAGQSGSGSTSTLGGAAATTTGLVGAGMVDGVPWTAEGGSSASCLKFTASGSFIEACVKAPNSLGWNYLNVNGKTFAFGVTAANVATVVVKSSTGVEIARTPVGPVANQPLLRLFAVVVPPGTTGAVVSGLDAAGVEIAPGIAAGV
jgi:hypothetical protein